MLCSDSLAFVDYYNRMPFGQFTRHLSNKSQDLAFADSWGNVIDEVHYYNSAPWPTPADGRGAYLELIDLNLDNSLAENWNAVIGVDEYAYKPSIQVYPNPSIDEIRIVLEADMNANEIAIYDMMGRKVFAQSLYLSEGQNEFTIQPNLKGGVYLLKIGSRATKIVRY